MTFLRSKIGLPELEEGATLQMEQISNMVPQKAKTSKSPKQPRIHHLGTTIFAYSMEIGPAVVNISFHSVGQKEKHRQNDQMCNRYKHIFSNQSFSCAHSI